LQAPIKKTEDVFRFFDSLSNFERGKIPSNKRNFRLDRMEALLKKFGNPHKRFKIFHVAGTKGKGSTAALLASVLEAGGYKTGLYTSPHVVSYLERFAVSMKPPEEALFTRLAERIRRRLHEFDSLPGGFAPTTFEVLTLLAFLIFREARCAFGVVETGIGGRLDATNVVTPEAAIITPLDLEHTDLLGNSLEEIAVEKGGIIKPGIPVFCGLQEEKVKDVLREIAHGREAPITFLDEVREHMEVRVDREGTDFILGLQGQENRSFHLNLCGTFQAENASLAFLTLSRILPDIPAGAYSEGFRRVTLPGRMELFGKDPPILLDGAHTPLAVARMLETYKTLTSDRGILIFGSVAGKKPDKMADLLAPHFKEIIISTPGSFKESDPEGLHRLFKTRNKSTYLEKDPVEALNRALRGARGKLPILITGSFYMIAEIRRILVKRIRQEN
jgi:dihydrofolate synthase/folylpolyglutamate synthase